MEETARKFVAPYLPWKTVFNFLERLEESGTPDRIDRTYLDNLSGQDQSYLLGALKLFGLIDDTGRLQPLMEELRNKATRPAAFRALLQTYYADAVALPDNATQGQLEEIFRDKYNVHGATLRKSLTFYLRAAQYAGIPVSKNFKSAGPAAGETTARPRRTTRRVTRRDPATASAQEAVPQPPVKNDPGEGSIPVHAMLRGAILWLSENGPLWTEAQADTWIESFSNLVRLVYPTSHPAPAPQRQGSRARPAAPATREEPSPDEEGTVG